MISCTSLIPSFSLRGNAGIEPFDSQLTGFLYLVELAKCAWVRHLFSALVTFIHRKRQMSMVLEETPSGRSDPRPDTDTLMPSLSLQREAE